MRERGRVLILAVRIEKIGIVIVVLSIYSFRSPFVFIYIILIDLKHLRASGLQEKLISSYLPPPPQ